MQRWIIPPRSRLARKSTAWRACVSSCACGGPQIIMRAAAIAVGIALLGILIGFYVKNQPARLDGEQLAALANAEEEKAAEALRNSWMSPLSAAEREAKLIADCEAREVGYRQELLAEPTSWKVQAKLAMSLLETNGSRFIPRPERLEEGRTLAEAAHAAKPDNWRTMMAKVDLMLAETKDVRSQEASTLALQAVEKRTNKFTNACAARALLVDGCALVCAVRRAQHRKTLDPPTAVYPAGKEPSAIVQSHMKAGLARLVDSGKRFYSAVDTELFERDNTTYGPDADKKVAEALFIREIGPWLKLVQLEHMTKGDNANRGVHPNLLFWAGGCDDFVGRKLDGKVCPPADAKEFEEMEKKAKKRKAGKAKKAAS